jgi:hypothetical protein
MRSWKIFLARLGGLQPPLQVYLRSYLEAWLSLQTRIRIPVLTIISQEEVIQAILSTCTRSSEVDCLLVELDSIRGR